MSPQATKDLFRQAWARFPTGIAVITFRQADGAIHGLTANAVCSVSLNPLLVLVCVDHNSRSYPMLMAASRFVMNFLAQGQEDISRFFASRDAKGHPPFRFRRTLHGDPILEGSVASLDAAITERNIAGDHTIFIARVEEIDLTDVPPLVFHTGKYSAVAPPIHTD
ncbi:MAG: flavin reductase [Dehalococcoidia bacterium]|nr:flavin reductase [Dehalococcoidia bacterium]